MDKRRKCKKKTTRDKKIEEDLLRDKSFLISEILMLKAQIKNKALLAANMEMKIAELDGSSEAGPNLLSAGSLYVDAEKYDMAILAFSKGLNLAKDKVAMARLIKESICGR
jgi:hypothetical protein